MDLCFKHIEEVENLEKKRFNDRTTGDRVALFTKSDGTAGTPSVSRIVHSRIRLSSHHNPRRIFSDFGSFGQDIRPRLGTAGTPARREETNTHGRSSLTLTPRTISKISNPKTSRLTRTSMRYLRASRNYGASLLI